MDINNSNKKFKFNNLWIFNKYIIIFTLIFSLLCVGGTYAYYALQVENEVAITGNVIAVDADLEIKLVAGTNTKMVPMNDGALANAIKGVGSTNGACIDKYGNLSCQVYKITLTNNGSRLRNLTGTIELYPKEGAGNVYSNLKWRELENATTIKNDAVINGMNESELITSLTMNSKEVKSWYIAVWISEANYDQVNTDKGLFGGTVKFEVDPYVSIDVPTVSEN